MAKLIPFVEIVEDSRILGLHPVSGPKPVVQRTPDGQNERIYCVSCHHGGGYVSVEDLPLVIYLCDEMSSCGCNCSAKGVLPLPRLDI